MTGELFGESLDQGTEENVASYLERYVGEGKKYASLEEGFEAFAKKAEHADKFIDTLKNEKRQLETSLEEATTKLKTTDEIVAEIYKHKPSPIHDEDVEEGPSFLTEEDVEKRVLNILSEKEKQKEIETRFWSTVTEGFGSKAEASKVIREYVGDNAKRKDLIMGLGTEDPEGLVRFLKTKQEEAVSYSEEYDSSQTEVEAPKKGTVFTKEYAQKVKRENPIRYNSVKFQKQLQEAIASNPNFYK